MENSFVFQVTPYDREHLLPQVSKALELRMNLLSAKKYPGIWTVTERLRGFSGGKTRSKTRSRIMGILFLLLGTFLFVPGLMDPKELTGPLLIGAVGILAGVFNLWSARKSRENPFDRSAKLLLDSKADLSASEEIDVIFDEDGMNIPDENGDPEIVPFDAFECAVKGPDLFLFVFDTRVIVLQKSDLYSENAEEFWAYISEKVPENISFS